MDKGVDYDTSARFALESKSDYNPPHLGKTKPKIGYASIRSTIFWTGTIAVLTSFWVFRLSLNGLKHDLGFTSQDKPKQQVTRQYNLTIGPRWMNPGAYNCY
jgi:hypothetical protein